MTTVQAAPLTGAELSEMRERCKAATPFTNNDVMRYEHGGGRIWLQEDGDGRKLVADLYHEGDREFFAHARTDIPRLLDELERTREALRKCASHLEWTADTEEAFAAIEHAAAVLPPDAP